MKKILSILTLTIAGLVAVPIVNAQDKPADKPAGDKPAGGERRGGGQRMDPEARLKQMTEKLGLNQEQQDKIKAAYAANAEKMKALRDDRSLSDEDRRAKFTEMRKTQDDAVNAILTPEQQTKWKEMREAARNNPRGGGDKPGEKKPEGDKKPGQ